MPGEETEFDVDEVIRKLEEQYQAGLTQLREWIDLLLDAKNERRVVDIASGGLHEPKPHGFVAGLSQDLLMLISTYDFRVDGFAVLNVADISEIRSGDAERAYGRVLECEGLLDELPTPPQVNLESWPALLRDLHAQGKHVGVECYRPGDGAYCLGKIVSVDDTSFDLLNFDAAGRWDAAATTVPYRRITLLEFGTRYIEVFSKYTENP